jgi:hypothetical protein
MGDINAACQALADSLIPVDGLRGKAYVDDQINAPEAQVFNRAYDPRLTLGGSPKQAVGLGLRIYVKRLDLRSAQLQLRGYMTSVLAAVQDSENWDAGTDYVEVVQIGAPFETSTGDAVYLAVDFDIDVVL